MPLPSLPVHRYALLRAEISRRLSLAGKWHGLPGLLDALHAARVEHRRAGS